jgi:hypothetical protein
LSLSTISSLDDHVSVVDKIKISIVWHFRNEVEISFDIETEFLIEFTLGGLSFPFINVDDIPLLMDLS